MHLKLNIPTIFTRVSYRVAPGRPAICAVYWLQHSKTHLWNCLIETTNTLQETSIYSLSNDISFINFHWNLLSVRCNWKSVVLIFSKFWTVRDDQRGLLQQVTEGPEAATPSGYHKPGLMHTVTPSFRGLLVTGTSYHQRLPEHHRWIPISLSWTPTPGARWPVPSTTKCASFYM